MDKPLSFSQGPGWRMVYLSLFFALFVGGLSLYGQLQRGVGYGESLILSAARDSAMADSIALAVDLAREAAEQANINNLIAREGVRRIERKMESLTASLIVAQRKEIRAVAAKTDSMQSKIGRAHV